MTMASRATPVVRGSSLRGHDRHHRQGGGEGGRRLRGRAAAAAGSAPVVTAATSARASAGPAASGRAGRQRGWQGLGAGMAIRRLSCSCARASSNRGVTDRLGHGRPCRQCVRRFLGHLRVVQWQVGAHDHGAAGRAGRATGRSRRAPPRPRPAGRGCAARARATGHGSGPAPCGACRCPSRCAGRQNRTRLPSVVGAIIAPSASPASL